MIITILIELSLLFRYQAMFLGNKNPIQAIKGSFDFFLKNKKYALTVWLVIIVISLITIPTSTALSLAEQ